MRERLIELIMNAVGGCARHWAEVIADHLLANGVIVPPFVVGDTVWCLQKEDGEYAGLIGEMFLAVVGDAVITTAFMYDFANDAEEAIEYYIQNTQDELSTDVEFYPLCDCFASREEAEKALAERSEDETAD
jgi:hypothetical protein